jgi:hypothetical protein
VARRVSVRTGVSDEDLIGEHARTGTTVLLATQDMEEADRLADQVTVLDRGRVIATDSPAELKAKVGGDHLELTGLELSKLLKPGRRRLIFRAMIGVIREPGNQLKAAESPRAAPGHPSTARRPSSARRAIGQPVPPTARYWRRQPPTAAEHVGSAPSSPASRTAHVHPSAAGLRPLSGLRPLLQADLDGLVFGLVFHLHDLSRLALVDHGIDAVPVKIDILHLR